MNPTVDLVQFEDKFSISDEMKVMPKAAFLIEHDPIVGNWEDNYNYQEEHGMTLVEEIVENPRI